MKPWILALLFAGACAHEPPPATTTSAAAATTSAAAASKTGPQPRRPHEHAAPPGPAAKLYDNLGDHHRAITTTNAEAQRYFDQGLRLSYAFNHEEAGRSFEAHLNQAVATHDTFPYDEPPDWYYPPRQTLGAWLLRAGKPAAAQQVFDEDLKKNPNNGWSLTGLRAALRAQKKSTAAVDAALAAAWKDADVKIASSDF